MFNGNIDYIEAGRKGLTGGTIWSRQAAGGMIGQENNQMGAGDSPKMIPIYYNGKPYLD